jgi:hypothetical protein
VFIEVLFLKIVIIFEAIYKIFIESLQNILPHTFLY